MAKKQKLTVKQAAMKFHKRGSLGLSKCGAYIDDPSQRDRVIKRDWRGVNCKNCLKQKK